MSRTSTALRTVMAQNATVVGLLSRYLNLHPRLLDADTVNSLARDCEIPREDAFLALLAAACGLNAEEHPEHRDLERLYLHRGVRRADPARYRADAYYRTVRFPTASLGRWELCEMCYEPYEPFVCGHPAVGEDLREIPQIGYFDERFSFPAVREGGVEWMTVTPNEIETMREPIAHAKGNVLTLGLGLGYFAFHASEKPSVNSVTVVERDPDVIRLFRTHLLPQFPNAGKIRIVQTDAFQYLEGRERGAFDSIFADLWHDPSDGLECYLRLRRIERERALPAVDYWIEPTLLSYLRHMVFRRWEEEGAPDPWHGSSPAHFLSDESLRQLAADIVPLA